MQDRTWELLQKHLETGIYDVVSAQSSAPSESELRAVADELGCPLSDEFVVHSTNQYGGLCVEVKEELWPRAEAFEVGPFWSFLYGFYTFNIAEGNREVADHYQLDRGLCRSREAGTLYLRELVPSKEFDLAESARLDRL